MNKFFISPCFVTGGDVLSSREILLRRPYFAPGPRYYCRKDAQGNIISLLDSTGNCVVKYVYDAWGNHKVLDADGNEITDPDHIGNLNPFRYRGYFFDKETGLYYLKSRYYDPETGRFLNADAVEYLDPESINGLNLYAYCLNNPVMNVDPSGHSFFGTMALLGIALGSFIIGGAGQLASNAIAGKTGSELWRGVPGAALGAAANAVMLCITMKIGILSLAISAVVGSFVQTSVDTLETTIRGEEIDWAQTGLNFATNFAITTIGNWLGGAIVPTKSWWFKPKHFLSAFLKPYGQKILLQALVGSALPVVLNGLKQLYQLIGCEPTPPVPIPTE